MHRVKKNYTPSYPVYFLQLGFIEVVNTSLQTDKCVRFSTVIRVGHSFHAYSTSQYFLRVASNREIIASVYRGYGGLETGAGI